MTIPLVVVQDFLHRSLVCVITGFTVPVFVLGLAGSVTAGENILASVSPSASSNAHSAADSSRLADAQLQSIADYVTLAIIPAHEQLAAAAQELLNAAADFEKLADDQTLANLRQQHLHTVQAVAAGQAFAFGPIHSLGLDAALNFPIDQEGIDVTLQGLGSASVNDIEQLSHVPSLGGLQAIAYLLHSEDPQSYADSTRRYLHAQVRRIARAAEDLLAVWSVGLDGNPPYAAVLTTAGEPGNAVYQSVHSAAEEIAHTWYGTLEFVVDEALPESLENVDALSSLAGRASIADLVAMVEGIHKGYLAADWGHWFHLDNAAVSQDIERSLNTSALSLASLDSESLAAQAVRHALEQAETGLQHAKSLFDRHVLETTKQLKLAAAMETPRLESIADKATVWNATSAAYEKAPPNLSQRAIEDHEAGDEAFEESFVASADHASTGLGPQFNNTSCVACHIRNGRGMPVPGQLLLRVSDSQPGGEAAVADESTTLEVKGNTPPVTGLGNQIQDFAIAGVSAEASVDIHWVESEGAYPDGTPYRLRTPKFEVVVASTGQLLPDSVRVSPRIPPHVYGLGLLEAITEADILALADPEDLNEDGISGRPNRVWNEQLQALSLGRFGWKANSPNLLQQTADAYLNDMGIHSTLFPAEDGSSEIDETTLVAATAYSQTLAVPARRSLHDPLVQRGETLFAEVGCNACHVEGFVTGEHDYPALSGQHIRPYTDMLLHDMGDELADGRADFEAHGREWRTPALWGIGLAQTVLPYSGFLHDGRARTLEEAILWHGGEAEATTDDFKHLALEDRLALLRFLGSL